ncbi:MAG TPA: tyrosine-type recombinase/integrase [Streptosporangiaceae bacterium]|nr:tyrosine-type recombinase/integrase [Streptosporangiaceae bacterium]
MARGRQRANGEGSIFPYRNGYASYVWVTTPDGVRRRKWAYGKTREETHGKWLKLHEATRRGPVVTRSPTLADYLAYWLREVVVEPDYAPLTCATYETMARLYIIPGLGSKRLDRLSLRDVRAWLNTLRDTCQCCAQGKDARRPEKKRRCCAKTPTACCRRVASERTIRDAWTILCSALTNTVTEELIPRNVAALLHVSKPRKRKVKPWSVDEARRFLESAKRDRDPLYAAYVLILVLGLRKWEVIGLPWSAVNLDRAELDIGWQLQRVRRQLLHRATKTEASDATLPLPGICVTALRMREKDQAEARSAATGWTDTGMVFTTRAGTPYEPRNFNRRFETRCAKAGVRRITVHDIRHTCATLLAVLDVHPRVVMRILRHAQIDVTMNVYTEVSDAKTLQALKRLGRQLDS